MIMQKLFGNVDFVKVYIDDIIIFSTSLEKHLQHIQAVLQILAKANLKLNPQKCQWVSSKIKILGHVVSKDKIEMDDDKITSISERKAPKTVKQVQEFLGLTGYYRSFIKNYSNIAAPLLSLLLANNKFIWTNECEQAFDKLKLALISKPILRQPDFNLDFILYTDASILGLGAILAQKDSDGKEYVCYYASRTLKPLEKHYGITEIECLAVLWAVNKFYVFSLRPSLHGCN